MLPRPFQVLKRRRETADTFTLTLAPPEPFSFLPGQFNMLYAFGVGEVPISISGDSAQAKNLVHTVRAVGAATQAICHPEARGRIGCPGPLRHLLAGSRG